MVCLSLRSFGLKMAIIITLMGSASVVDCFITNCSETSQLKEKPFLLYTAIMRNSDGVQLGQLCAIRCSERLQCIHAFIQQTGFSLEVPKCFSNTAQCLSGNIRIMGLIEGIDQNAYIATFQYKQCWGHQAFCSVAESSKNLPREREEKGATMLLSPEILTSQSLPSSIGLIAMKIAQIPGRGTQIPHLPHGSRMHRYRVPPMQKSLLI